MAGPFRLSGSYREGQGRVKDYSTHPGNTAGSRHVGAGLRGLALPIVSLAAADRPDVEGEVLGAVLDAAADKVQ